jgi:hypothetical protein
MVKLKYKFKVHHLLEAYPTEEDALYDIVNFLTEKNRLDQEWSDLGIKGAFQKKLTEDEISDLLKSLVDQGFLSLKEGSGKRNYFRIINNPFIEK